MEPEQALKEIESNTIRPAYLLYGEEYFHVLAILTALRQQVIQDTDGGMSLSEYNGPEATPARVLDDLRTMTFFGGMRLVIVDNADSFVADNKDALGRYAKSPAKSACLVLVCGKKPDARWVFVKAVQETGAFVPCDTPKPWKLVTWVRGRAQVLGKSIGQSAARLLLEIVGADMAQLDSHLRMLVTYVGKRKTISDADVAATVEEEKTVQVWDLMDGIATKDGKMALEALDRLLPKTGMEAPRLSLIGTTLLRLRSVKNLMERHGSEARVAQALNMHPFFAKKNIEHARKFTSEELSLGVRKALEADILIKNNRMKPRLAVEKLIVELCK